jgi:hypothetical protein
MTLTAPDWLTRHDGSIKLGSDGTTWYVLLGSQPQYALMPRPIGNHFGCHIKQTNNGRIVATTGALPGHEEALKEGLDQLRKVLGW